METNREFTGKTMGPNESQRKLRKQLKNKEHPWTTEKPHENSKQINETRMKSKRNQGKPMNHTRNQ